MKKIKRVTSSGLVMIYIYIIDVDTYSVGQCRNSITFLGCLFEEFETQICQSFLH